jgi:hypothetical protein
VSRLHWTSIKSALKDNLKVAITLYRDESWTAARGRTRHGTVTSRR